MLCAGGTNRNASETGCGKADVEAWASRVAIRLGSGFTFRSLRCQGAGRTSIWESRHAKHQDASESHADVREHVERRRFSWRKRSQRLPARAAPSDGALCDGVKVCHPPPPPCHAALRRSPAPDLLSVAWPTLGSSPLKSDPLHQNLGCPWPPPRAS